MTNRTAPWVPGVVHRAMITRGKPTIRQRDALIYRGLGLVEHFDECWALIHLHTGHAACWLFGSRVRVLPLATQVAELCDWDAFLTFAGWRQVSPTLKTDLESLIALHPEDMVRHLTEVKSNADLAAEIATLRA